MRKFTKLSVPPHAHPLVRKLWEVMNQEMLGPADVAERAGLCRDALIGWRTRRTPRIHDLEACFNVLGKRLVVDTIPDPSGVTERSARKNILEPAE
jgi:hypothetical protein